MTRPPPPPSSRRLGSDRPRLLLVEDDANLRTALVRSLHARFSVTAIDSGAAAAELLISQRFDVVLSDILLGGMNGIELLKLVRMHDLDVPVILMTGVPDLDGAIQALDLGALTYIKKPFDTAVLDAALERATKLAALARAKREAIDAGLGGSPASGERGALAASFDRALDSMWIAYQPIVDAQTRETVGYEALMRTREATMPSPGAILDAANRLGRMHDVGRCVRERIAASLEGETDPRIQVFVNLHAADLEDEDLFDAAAPLTRHAGRIVLELTERAAIADVGDARMRASQLRARGFKVAIDDLGAGYAGLTSFATFEPEIVKLDMSLIRGIEASSTKRLIVGRITSLCQELKMKVVAEGIETTGELGCMLDLGCEYLQGYLLGRPAEPRTPSAYAWPAQAGGGASSD